MKIDLKRIIERLNLNRSELAQDLYPDNKYPLPALARVESGEAELEETQISMLSHITGISVDDLFKGGSWSVKSKDEEFTFTKGDFTAKVNIEEGNTKISYRGTMVHETLIHSKLIPLSEYFTNLNCIIDNIEKNEKRKI